MHTKSFNKISIKDVSIAGGKGASLGEMVQAGMAVPPGFAILASAFEDFLKKNGLEKKINGILSEIQISDSNQVESASGKIVSLINEQEVPNNLADEIREEYKNHKLSRVAVRSSATSEDSLTASWAGELETYLNVDEDNLLDSVKKCWSSLYSPRAILYRFEKGMNDQQVLVAVVVQQMIQSEVSGITFTVHPVTKDKDQMVIEAGYGLGEAIVGGMITPDNYIISKKDDVILEKNIAEQSMMITRGFKDTEEKEVPIGMQNQQKLNDSKILELSKICKHIEEHYKKPQDIEWAMEKGKIYITQSRPITTL